MCFYHMLWVIPEYLNKGWSLEGWGLLCSGSVERQNAVTFPALGWSEGLTGILLCLSHFFFYQPLSHLGSLCGIDSAVCKAWECLLEKLRKRWAHLCHGLLVQKGNCDCKKEALDSSWALYKHLKHVCLNPITDS